MPGPSPQALRAPSRSPQPLVPRSPVDSQPCSADLCEVRERLEALQADARRLRLCQERSLAAIENLHAHLTRALSALENRRLP
jgi:hypothetical protein